jgi:8-oxo-dGTP diphosphatase
VLLREDRAALLQLRDEKPGLRASGKWVFPGGHCDAGEGIEACAMRELYEETDYVCRNVWHLTSIIDDSEAGFENHYLTFFWAPFDGRQSLCCREGQELKFIDRDVASHISSPAYLLTVWDLAIARFSESIAKGI